MYVRLNFGQSTVVLTSLNRTYLEEALVRPVAGGRSAAAQPNLQRQCSVAFERSLCLPIRAQTELSALLPPMVKSITLPKSIVRFIHQRR